MNKIIAHIKILRPLNLTIGALAVLITASILKEMDSTTSWLTALFIVVFSNAAANVLNDYFDQETDRINRPKRPLVTGEVKPPIALIMAIGLFLISTILSFTLPITAVIIAVVITLPLTILYSICLKGLPLIGNIVISLILGLTFLFAGAALGNTKAMLIPAVLAFGLTLVRELIKDIADVEGDRKAQLRTLPVIWGVYKSWFLAAILAGIVIVGAILPYLFGPYNNWYLIIVIFGVEIPLLITVFSMMKFPTINTATRSAKLLKFSTIAGVFAVWLGSM